MKQPLPPAVEAFLYLLCATIMVVFFGQVPG